MRRILLAALLPLAAWAADAAPAPTPYPLTTCVVSGEALGGMGAPVVAVRQGRELKFCCKGCIKDFDKDPAKYLKALDATAAKPAAKPAAQPAAK